MNLFSRINHLINGNKEEKVCHESMKISLVEGVAIEFMRVPAGKFRMGSEPKNARTDGDELPQHKVHLDAYWIGKYPVTVAQFAAFMKVTGYQCNAISDLDLQNKVDHPVVNVTWNDAAAFCEWASKAAGQKVYLPSEAQWEKAARGTDGRIYPWGDKEPSSQQCNFNNNEGATMPVGTYSPEGDSPYGCADMAGNVWEWVADWYDKSYYRYSPRENPTGPSSGEYRILRGGSWDVGMRGARTANRIRLTPDSRYYDDGFRCAC